MTGGEEPGQRSGTWPPASGKLLRDLPGHDSPVRSLEALPGSVVRTVSLRGTATTWDCSTGKRLCVTPKPPEFPRRFGACELIRKGEKFLLHAAPR